MAEEFGQQTSPVAALKSILGNYPYSVGLLREILQNSDDARASRQIFVLDRRTHPKESLYHAGLAQTQGPALLAFNDAHFSKEDWISLRSAFESSKTDDSSKIGKYGVGFRSVFHITDCPQIISGKHIAMFDPLSAFIGSSGIRTELETLSSRCPNQLVPFKFFSQVIYDQFDGTIIRCPLRTTSSTINSRVIAPDDIAYLFRQFISEELGVTFLFLQSLQHLEIHDVSEEGVSRCLATLSIDRSHNNSAIVNTFVHSMREQRNWRVMLCPFEKEEAIALLSQKFTVDPTTILKEHKLLPSIGIATVMDRTTQEKASGRLFTYLPLPISTGFPVHLHALFALTQSRQNLRNAKEIGVVPGSADSILIEWNRLLFEHYIPRAWNHLLKAIAQELITNDITIFNSWPPEQRSVATAGEHVYWQLLPLNVFRIVVHSNSPVWPVYRSSSRQELHGLEFRPLDLLITAAPSVSRRVLDVLTSLGLFFTCPPLYIFNMIAASSDKAFGILTPEVAHAALLTHLDSFTDASKDDLMILLEYLLSTDNVRNIIGLPLISVSSGATITLLDKQNASDTYTMLARDESAIFGSCDDNAIELGSLPYQIAQKLTRYGPEHLNIQMLSVSRIVAYLTIYPNRLGLDLSLIRSDPKAVRWLSAFWIWVNTYSERSELFPRIRDLYLLPSTKGLRKADRIMFKSRGEHPNSVNHLSKIGIPFLDPELSDAASHVLTAHSFVKLIIDAYMLLDFLANSSDLPVETLQLSHDECNTVMRHMALYLPTSYSRYGRALTQAQNEQLRRLPIYPIATFSSSQIAIQRDCLDDNISYRSIGNPPFLPSVPNVGFLQMNTIATPLLDYLDPNSPISRLSDQQILSLTVDHFAEQSPHVHEAVLDYISRNPGSTSTMILDKLREVPFVYSLDGHKRKPSQFIDPDSAIARLYNEDQSRLPRQVTSAEKNIVRSLRLLGRSYYSTSFMRRTLTLEIVQERINFIANDSSSPNNASLAETLLNLIVDAQYDLNYSSLVITPQQRWLPTNWGLRSSEECRDPNKVAPALFNHVLAELRPFNLPASLINILGWDQPLATDILVNQLDRALDSVEHTFSDILQLVQMLSSRQDCDFERLRQITSTRKWVPTTDQQLSETQNAIFASPIADTGFHQALCLNSGMRTFLQLMGCTDSPTANAILGKLKELQSDPLDLTGVGTSISLLRCLPTDLDQQLRSMILVPAEDCRLHPILNVYFNDIGEHARLIPLEQNAIAHPLVEEPLAKKLRLGRLGLKSDVDFDLSSIDMGEKPITTVRKALSQYTDTQFATEFFANAADANATEFALVLDEFSLAIEEDIQALSPAMVKFCTSPALIVYNNSVFEDQDFIGIRKTNIGGKNDRTETIGQFGLGALTMFHFTELAVIISNKHVLFLNPSMEHLPIADVAAVMLPLNTVRKFYSSHLRQVDGLFDFDISSTEPYNGTIFLLPLRQASHLEGLTSSVASSVIRSTDQIKHDILDNFCTTAPQCLFFTGILKVSAVMRSQNKRREIIQECLWCFWADHDSVETESDTGYKIHNATITDDAGVVVNWKIAQTSTSNIPSDVLSALRNRHQPRLPVSAGLAVELQEETIPSRSSNYNFFSTLPLAISTSLPMHVMATFFLSSDRRSIRSTADKDNPESRFNAWILSELIPPLYLFMLQKLLEYGDNKAWWPMDNSPHKDIHSQVIIEEFYSKHLRASPRPVFQSYYDSELSIIPRDVVLSGEEPRTIEKALSMMSSPSVARLHQGAYRLAKYMGALSIVGPLFLRNELLSNASSVVTHFTIKEVEELIRYLLRKAEDVQEDEENILGLTILPMEDGSYGTIKARRESPTYFVWWPRDASKQHNFPPQYFVHPLMKFKEDLLKLPLNIIFLDPASIVRFVGDHVPASSSFVSERAQAEWIERFWDSWKEYAILGLLHSEIMEYPLVPTVIPGHFVSLSSCKNSLSVVIPGDSQQTELIRLVLTQLSIDVVRLDDDHIQTPASLYEILRSDEFPSFNFENVVKALTYVRGDISRAILDFEQEWQDAFATWARGSIQEIIPHELQAIAQGLPLWPSASSTSGGIDLRPALDVFMLPSDLSVEVASQFMNVHVAEYGSLRFLNGPCLTATDIQGRLDLPVGDNLSAGRLIAYRQFLEMWFPIIPRSIKNPVPVPNNHGTIMLSTALYAREPLFEAAFGTDSDVFLHSSFEQLEPLLYDRGLHTETQLDFDLFLTCVNAFESSQLGININEDVARANVLFESFGFSLPMQVLPNEASRWRELDELRFIPRNMDDRRRLSGQHSSQGFLLPMNITSLEVIVSPSDLVVEEFEAIAWTQRATFASQPNHRVLLAYPDLGRPTIREVLAHLDAIATISKLGLSKSQQAIIAHDVAKTYAFLNTNSAAAVEAIATLDDSRSTIFLNVDDPETDDWRWDKVDDLVFETQDVDDNIRHVRKFLLPFSGLLTAAGVLPIHHPQYPSSPVDAASPGLASLHLSFNNLRQKHILTDILFITDDHVEGAEPIAHRAFLAACSEYFADAFSENYQEAREASSENPVRLLVDNYTTQAVETVLDYAYTRTRPEIEESSLELFLEVLKLSNMWNMLDIFEDVQREIAVKWVKPRFLGQIREAADSANADNLLRVCMEYEEKNPELIRRYNERATT